MAEVSVVPRWGDSSERRKNWGGGRIMRFERARESHLAAGRKRAAVCSRPPSGVGVGMTTSSVSAEREVALGEVALELELELELGRGRK